MKSCIALFLSLSISAFATTRDSECSHYECLRYERLHQGCFETDDCIISLLENEKNERFILKQLKDSSPDEQFLLVLDTLGCHIAKSASIPMNHVEIIPASKSYFGKTKDNLPATLHTFAIGKSIEEDPLFEVDIHQRFPKKRNAHYGAIAPESIGLTRRVIKNMAKHPDLPKIAALDTFVGNADRSSPNLFYCKETNRFCGIDLAAGFSSPLAKEAFLQIQRIEDEGRDLSYEERTALLQYARTLKRLVEDFPPERQKMLLCNFAKEAGFEEGSSLWNQDIEDRMAFHTKHILSNYEHSQKLVSLVGKMLSTEDLRPNRM